jgi:hypothetical protein
VIESSLLRRVLVGLVVFAGMVILGVVLAAGGDQGARRPSPGHLPAANAMSSERSPRHAADAAQPRPNPRAPKRHRAGSRSNPL